MFGNHTLFTLYLYCIIMIDFILFCDTFHDKLNYILSLHDIMKLIGKLLLTLTYSDTVWMNESYVDLTKD